MPNLTDTELDTALDVALEAADRAVTIARTTPVGSIETKKHAADHVTEVDRATERMVRELVEERLPGHSVVGEEYGGTADEGPTWFCDPVDGTTNLSAGLPWTSFSLALAIGSDPLVAVGGGRSVACGSHAGGLGPGLPDRRPAVAAGRGRRPDGGRRADRMGRLPPVAGTAGAARPAVGPAVHDPDHGVVDADPRASAAGRTLGAVVGEFHPEDHLAAALLCSEAGLAVLDEDGRDNRFPAAGGLLVARRGVAEELFGLWRDVVREADPPTSLVRRLAARHQFNQAG